MNIVVFKEFTVNVILIFDITSINLYKFLQAARYRPVFTSMILSWG